MKSITLILSLVCSGYEPEYLPIITEYMNSKALSPVMELSTSVLDKDIKDICRRNPEQTLDWATKIILSVDRNNWIKEGAGTIYTPLGQDYRPHAG